MRGGFSAGEQVGHHLSLALDLDFAATFTSQVPLIRTTLHRLFPEKARGNENLGGETIRKALKVQFAADRVASKLSSKL